MKNVTKQKNITGERIKELREEEGKTQEELANDLSVSREALANFETRRDIAEDRLQDIANHFNTTVDYLLGETNVRCNNKDYQLIGKYTGLDDKAIEILGELKIYAPNIIDTINYLISQEEFFSAGLTTIENEDEAMTNYNKAEDYWDEIHFPILSKIADYYNVDMPKETLCITDKGIKNKKDFKNKYEMMRETKATLSAKNLVDNGLLEEVEYQLKNSKEIKNNKSKQKEQSKQMKKYIEKYNKYGTIKKGENKK